MTNCTSIQGPILGCASTITLPGTQGPTGATGAAGAAGVSLLHNSRTRVDAAANTSLQPLATYSVVNIPTEVLDEDGDAIYLETMFNVASGVSGTFYLEYGAANTVVSYTVNSPLVADMDIILSAFITRIGGHSQDVEAAVTVCGQPNFTWTKPIATDSQDLTADIALAVKVQKIAEGVSGDVTCNYFKVLKYEI